MHLGDTPHNLTESDFENLASQTEGFSGSDISVCVSATPIWDAWSLSLFLLLSLNSVLAVTLTMKGQDRVGHLWAFLLVYVLTG